MSSKLQIRGSWYLDGSDYVVVVTGQPEHAVQIGVGSSVEEAWQALQDTALQSVGLDCGEAAALRWAHGAGWISAETTRPDVTATVEALDLPEECEDAREALGEALEAWLDEQDWLEPADAEAAASVTEPVGEVDWSDEVEAYVACVYGRDGDEPGDCYVRIGEDELGLWWLDDGDDDERPNQQGPFNREREARAAAEALAEEQNEAESGEDADDMRDRLLHARAGKPDPKGEWCVYWETAGDDAHVVDRYATHEAAQAAAEIAQAGLQAAHPGGNLLCAYGVRTLTNGEWVEVEDET